MSLALELIEIALLAWIVIELRGGVRALQRPRAAEDEGAPPLTLDPYRSISDMPMRNANSPPYRVL